MSRAWPGLVGAVAVFLAVPLAAGAGTVMPHRALYDLSLASTRASGGVVGVDGRMMFQWGDSCDGWTIEQRYRMRLTRVHVDAPLATGTEVVLPESAAAHLARVLRLGMGDECVLFNGDGHDYAARIVAVGKRELRVAVTAGSKVDNESPLAITLLQGVARGEKMDLILQKATELGVSAIAPLWSQRSEVKLDEARTASGACLAMTPAISSARSFCVPAATTSCTKPSRSACSEPNSSPVSR